MDSAHDPGRVRLRGALRTALLAPAAYWVCAVPLALDTGAVYGAFATLVLTGFVDFQGRLRDRFVGYLAGALAGALLIAICAALAHNRIAAVAGAFVLTFAVLYLAVLRGYFASAARGLLLPVALAATNWNMSVGELVAAELGWVIGALVSAVGAIVLWPAPASRAERHLIATGLDLAATSVADSWPAPGTAREPDRILANREELANSQNRLRASFSSMSSPGAGNRRDRGLMQLVDQLGQLRLALHTQVDPNESVTVSEADQRLVSAMVDSLRACAGALRGKGEPPEPSTLALASADHAGQVIETVDRWLPEGRSGDLRRRLSGAFGIRLASSLTELIVGSTDLAIKGRRPDPEKDPSPSVNQRASIIETRPTRVMADHLTWRSPWLRNSLRSAVAVAAAVAVVALIDAPVGFWVVLGAITALRSSATGTGRTVLQAMAGTIIGLVIASGLVYFAGDTLWIYWALFAPMVFAAVYLMGGHSFVISQTAFTLCVLVVFALVLGPHLQTGEIRLLDVALGAACSLVLSLLLWPRGIAPQVLMTIQGAVSDATVNLAAALDRLVGGAEYDHRAELARHQALRTAKAAFDAFDLSLSNPGEHAIDHHAWTILSGIDIELNAAAEQINRTTHPDYSKFACPGVADDLVAVGQLVRARLMTTLDELPSLTSDTVEVLPAPFIPPTTGAKDSLLGDPVTHLFTDLDACLERIAADPAAGPARTIVTVVWTAERLAAVQRVALNASRIQSTTLRRAQSTDS